MSTKASTEIRISVPESERPAPRALDELEVACARGRGRPSVCRASRLDARGCVDGASAADRRVDARTVGDVEAGRDADARMRTSDGRRAMSDTIGCMKK